MDELPEYLNPAKNFTPRQNPPKIAAPEISGKCNACSAEKLTEEDLAALQLMSQAELIALIKRCSGHSWRVGMMSKEQIADAMMHRLAEKALDPAGRETLAAIQQWLDREKGKAVTPIAAQIKTVDDKPVDKRELARKIDFLMRMAQEEPNNPALPPAA